MKAFIQRKALAVITTVQGALSSIALLDIIAPLGLLDEISVWVGSVLTINII